jgi:hypothetical protein
MVWWRRGVWLLLEEGYCPLLLLLLLDQRLLQCVN